MKGAKLVDSCWTLKARCCGSYRPKTSQFQFSQPRQPKVYAMRWGGPKLTTLHQRMSKIPSWAAEPIFSKPLAVCIWQASVFCVRLKGSFSPPCMDIHGCCKWCWNCCAARRPFSCILQHQKSWGGRFFGRSRKAPLQKQRFHLLPQSAVDLRPNDANALRWDSKIRGKDLPSFCWNHGNGMECNGTSPPSFRGWFVKHRSLPLGADDGSWGRRLAYQRHPPTQMQRVKHRDMSKAMSKPSRGETQWFFCPMMSGVSFEMAVERDVADGCPTMVFHHEATVIDAHHSDSLLPQLVGFLCFQVRWNLRNSRGFSCSSGKVKLLMFVCHAHHTNVAYKRLVLPQFCVLVMHKLPNSVHATKSQYFSLFAH